MNSDLALVNAWVMYKLKQKLSPEERRFVQTIKEILEENEWLKFELKKQDGKIESGSPSGLHH